MKNYLSFKRGLLTLFIILVSLANAFAIEVTVNLHTSFGDPIEGSDVQYYDYQTGGAWTYFGTTDANGQANGELTTNISNTTAAVRILYSGRWEKKYQDVALDDEIYFETIPVTMKLLNSEGYEIVGNYAQYYSSGWKIFGDGSTTETIELLGGGGTYKFKLYHNSTFKQVWQDVSVDPIVIFETVNITLNFTGNIKFRKYGWITFSGPSMEVFPDLYTFSFSGVGYSNVEIPIVVSNDGINKTAEYIKLTSSIGMGIEGAATQFNDDSWNAGNSTNSNGSCINLLEGYVENATTRLYYGGTYEDIEQDLSDDSFVDFNTVLVSMDLENSLGDPLESSNAEYYANGWQVFGDGITSESIEMLPQAYNFRVSYAAAQNAKMQDVSINSQVSFSTIPVTVNLMDSNGDDLTSTNVMYIGSNGIVNQFGDGLTPISKELLPNDYTFRMYYADAILDKDQNVSMDANVEFSTIPVTMNVYDEGGNVLNGTDATYSYSGSTMFGDGTTPSVMELLPVSYGFSAMYDGNPLAASQNTAFNPNVSFTITAALPALVSLDEDQLFEEDELIMVNEFIESNSSIFEAEEIKASTANAYPNPFTESITLSYEVEADAKVNISVYNMNGVLISTLVDGNMHKGNYEVKWNADDNGGSRVPNGTYIYKISIDNNVESNTMILQK